ASLRLEEELQAKLQDSWITETRHRAKQSFVCDRSARTQVSEVRVIENIERLSTELNRGSLTETEELGQREIHARRRWTINSTARSITSHIQDTRSARGSLLDKTGSVEPLVYGVRCVVVRIAQQSRSTTSDDCRDESNAGGIVTGARHCKWQTRVVAADARKLPSSQHRIP